MTGKLHYHVVVDDDPAAVWTTAFPSAARRIQARLKQEQRSAHIYSCLPSDPPCPSKQPTNDRPSDRARSNHDRVDT